MKTGSFLCLFLCWVNFLNAQSKQGDTHDTTYYTSFTDKLVSRGFLDQRYTKLRLSDSEDGSNLTYKPDNVLSLGTGVSYGWFTFNLSYGFGFLNSSKDKGTKYFNLQSHSYSQKNIVDLFAQFYSVKPSFKTQFFGGSYQYVFNNKRFSYRAAFLQNEWQKKSSGTFLLGAETYFGTVKGDSTIIPVSNPGSAGELKNHTVRFYEFGPNIGYTYTLVIKQHFSVTGSLSVSMDYGRIIFESDVGKNHKDGFNPNFFTRVSGGYTTNKWALNAIWLNDNIRMKGKDNSRKLNIDNGNVRIVYTYRFNTGPKFKKKLRFLN
ncbi:DUF4421 domain-containing protein [Solitalea sp. MAHUQ-68]|uniref:DUF4421 domain-containing protein n=1 Tax=Solitalea agri TaxID=2953739 RepID=A0A9X2FA21_9SPHI|nr:DUF4421 family protein [Solitalea agri]MCO4294663.1 DUF4421 domain-containing protein [Solitalea agri]